LNYTRGRAEHIGTSGTGRSGFWPIGGAPPGWRKGKRHPWSVSAHDRCPATTTTGHAARLTARARRSPMASTLRAVSVSIVRSFFEQHAV